MSRLRDGWTSVIVGARLARIYGPPCLRVAAREVWDVALFVGFGAALACAYVFGMRLCRCGRRH